MYKLIKSIRLFYNIILTSIECNVTQTKQLDLSKNSLNQSNTYKKIKDPILRHRYGAMETNTVKLFNDLLA